MEKNKNIQLNKISKEIIKLENNTKDLFDQIVEIKCSIKKLNEIIKSLQSNDPSFSGGQNNNNMVKEILKEEKKVIQLKNGQVNIPFEEMIELEKFDIPNDTEIEFSGIEGLEWDNDNKTFKGSFLQSGEFSGSLSFYLNEDDKENGKPKIERKVDILVNADPKDLWKNIEPPSDGRFFKSNSEFAIEKIKEKTLLGVSLRGKSHANKGTFRDDHFEINFWPDKNWALQVVSDGAGSAEFSREGSKIACNAVLDKITKFIESDELNLLENGLIEQYYQPSSNGDEVNVERQSNDELLDSNDNEISNNKEIGTKKAEQSNQLTFQDLIYKVTIHPAFEAQKNIKKFAEDSKIPVKEFSSTLLFALSKDFEFGTIVISFSVGDGAIGVITEKAGKLVMNPDGGEFSGQTRFITMNEIFQDDSVYDRLQINLFSDKVKAIILMSDGISDPKFGTDNNLKDSNMWLRFWMELKPILVDNKPTEESLLEWIDFHEKGEYDDRTLTVLY